MKMPFCILKVAFLACITLSCVRTENKAEPYEKKIDKLMAEMTLGEKIGQMSQIDPGMAGSPERLKEMVREGRCGSLLNFFGMEEVNEIQRIAMEESRMHIPLLIGRDVIHGYKTVFPIPLGMAATWNPDMVKKAFRISAVEASSMGIRWTFAPMIDITWDPRWGRIAEGCGEDPFLASVLAAAMVEGIQGDSLNDPTALAACAKHFAGYGFAEAGRDYNTTYITEPVMRNVVLKPFKAAVDAGAQTIMTAFNDLNGVPATANEFLLKNVLHNEWGFEGMVVSDWGSVPEMINHGYCRDEKDAAAKAVKAGVDMEMATNTYSANIKQLLEEGTITESMIDNAVRDILRLKFRLGLFDNPYVRPEAQKILLDESHLEHARKVAVQSTVMLKNDNQVLPLPPGIKSIAVIGPLADAPRDQLGTWCFDGDDSRSVTPLQALKNELGPERVHFAAGLEYSRDNKTEGFAAALKAAARSDVIVFFAGEEWILSGEGQSRGEINLPGAQTELIRRLAATGKPLVMVVMAGRPLAIEEETQLADAVLYAWHGGTMAGPAIADLLTGRESPSGKLPVTFVKGAGQIPFYYYRKNTGRPASEETWTPIGSIPVENPQTSLGYRSFHLDYGYTPLFPFGYGLSYTTFEYSDLELSGRSMDRDGLITVRATVENTGNRDAHEVVQLYVRDRVGSITRPVKELKGFKRIFLKKGEKAVVEFVLGAADLAFFNGKETVVEPGEFDVWIGTDSSQGLHGEFIVQ